MLYALLFAGATGLVLADSAQLPKTTTVGGTAYTWKGAVAYGTLDPSVPDEFGYSLGGIGSAIAVKKWRKNSDGTYSGTIVAQPDRGHNTVQLENFAAREQFIDFTLNPCTSNTCNKGTQSLSLTYTGGLRYTDTSPLNGNGGFTSGLDPVQIRPATSTFPELPMVQSPNNALAVDAEGIALMADGSHWTSDEYGPTIYHIAADGTILSAIMPPPAFLPHDSTGALNFATETGATIVSGRTTNQGFEGLTISADNKRLYVLLQTALAQDQNLADDTTTQYTRMIGYDISHPAAPVLVEEYVVQLPAGAGKVYGGSELHRVSDGVFMLLARDGKGDGNGSSTSKLTSAFKNIGLVDTRGASNIAGVYDSVGASVAPNGVLRSDITAVQFNNFIDIIDDAQLARFGLQNGKPAATDIVGKWESIAIAPVLDAAFPNDYFVFSMADNDFISTKEWVDGVNTGPDPYGADVPNAVFVWRVTLPGADYPSYLLDRSLTPSGLARRRLPRSLCAANLETCPLGEGRFECVDVESNLEQCGACAHDGGVDCTQLAHVAGVDCVAGACQIQTCESGYKLVDGKCI
ncbi:hypothetical protein JCM10908_003903 [Rhodotorula pacifica]|uniref:uncharacterized protein n=1 Tax=Rhodotorula pacifica TaxID=1495444 RepID=UPI003170D4E4